MKEVEYDMEQRAIADFVKQLYKKFDRAYWNEKAEKKEFPQEMWDVMAENGYFGMAIPEKYGGSASKYSDIVVFLDELGQRGVFLLHIVGTFMDSILISHGNEEIKQKYLPQISKGANFAFAITEPDAGTNTFKMTTSAIKEGDYYKISGQKLFITGADESQYMILVARTISYDEVENKRDGISIFVVDSHSPGIKMQAQDVEMFTPEMQYTVFFDDVMVPAENLIGEENKGFDYLFDGLNMERIVIASYCQGLGKFALKKGVDYAKKRNLFGAPIGSYQSLQHPLTRAFIGLHMATMTTHQAATMLDAGKSPKLVGLYANMAKLNASEQAFNACDISIQVHGGYGMTRECDVITISNMVRAMRVAPINNEMILNFIGEQYLKLPKSY